MHRFWLGSRPHRLVAFDFHQVVAYHPFVVFGAEFLGRLVDLGNLVVDLNIQVVLGYQVDSRVVRNLRADIILEGVGTVLVAVKQAFLLMGLNHLLVSDRHQL